jgi:hypothetical protein
MSPPTTTKPAADWPGPSNCGPGWSCG